ncbi:hypothetical protein A1359_13450 [Methylomonas lenta]|uniref:Uncharacterized protein n=1 Tax=Methylomonas lenta TaxID=980561 RepID=A0A177N3V8_9GAMM|nr:VPLPA-CTERM sorting domain-containing protein [Methylomonas lenta]OAI12687.1 hypothetical protein A1359_13450 [Methylomonas lenta]
MERKLQILPILIICGMTLAAPNVNANMISLNFTTYTTSIGGSSGYSDFWNNPLQSSYSISLDSTTLQNFASTTAYNNTPNYTETVTTALNNGGQNLYAWGTDTLVSNGTINQSFTQLQTVQAVNREMRNGVQFTDSSTSYTSTNQVYTGNLPPELIPTLSNQHTRENSYANFDWSASLGTDPEFVVYDEQQLASFLFSLIGNQFNFYKSSNISACLDLQEWGCSNQTQLSYRSESGYAILSSFNVGAIAPVPLPTAFWLFTSGLGVLGFARKRKI